MISEKESRMIYILKAIAIVSVICAHISVVPDHFSKESIMVCAWLSEVGAIGVGIFFCVSGYLFAYGKDKEKSFVNFLMKKITTIGIPWIISASLVYFYVAVRKGGSFLGWLLSVVGYMSSYWFLSVLFALYLIYYFIRKAKRDTQLAIFMALLSIVSVVLRGLGVIRQDSLGVYLNVFNWSIFFSLGYILSKVDKKRLSKLLDKKITIVLTVVTAAVILMLPMCDIEKFSYFSYTYIPIEIVIIWTCMGWAYGLSNKIHAGLLLIGKMSFAIYLYNELVWAGLVANIGNKFDFWMLLLVRPVIVGGAVICELLIGRWIFGLFNKSRVFDALTGVRL